MFKKLLLGTLVICGLVSFGLGTAPAEARAKKTATPKITATQKNIAAPEIASRAALLIDEDNDTVLFDKNATRKNYPASLTKVMTALLTLENGELDDKFTITAADLNLPDSYETDFFHNGEKLTVEELLYALLLPSANAAGNTLARYVDGNIPAFVDRMNAKAKALGCKKTHFLNTYGLHNPDHYTTCMDLYLITKAAMKYPAFRKIVRTPLYTFPAYKGLSQDDREMWNNNYMLYNDEPYYDARVRGVKTGYTDAAGRCLIAMAQEKKTKLYVVVLGGGKEDGEDLRYLDAEKLFNYGFALKK